MKWARRKPALQTDGRSSIPLLLWELSKGNVMENSGEKGKLHHCSQLRQIPDIHPHPGTSCGGSSAPRITCLKAFPWAGSPLLIDCYARGDYVECLHRREWENSKAVWIWIWKTNPAVGAQDFRSSLKLVMLCGITHHTLSSWSAKAASASPLSGWKEHTWHREVKNTSCQQSSTRTGLELNTPKMRTGWVKWHTGASNAAYQLV